MSGIQDPDVKRNGLSLDAVHMWSSVSGMTSGIRSVDGFMGEIGILTELSDTIIDSADNARLIEIGSRLAEILKGVDREELDAVSKELFDMWWNKGGAEGEERVYG